MLQQLIKNYKDELNIDDREHHQGFERIVDFLYEGFFYEHVLPNSIDQLKEYESIIQNSISEQENKGKVTIFLANINECESDYFYNEQSALSYIKSKLKEVIEEESENDYFSTDVFIRPISIFISSLDSYFVGKTLEEATLYFQMKNF